MSTVVDSLKYVWMGLNQIGPQKLQRTPEPSAVMNSETAVSDFDQLIKTQTASMYMYILNLASRLQRKNEPPLRALDVACGPGHLAVQLHQVLKYNKVWGVDLAENMLAQAKMNAQEFKNYVQFEKMDVTQLDFENQFFDLCAFFQSAHHLPTLNHVRKTISECERVTNPNGVIIIGDVCRLRTAKNTERFIKTACDSYLRLGLKDLYVDSVNSLNAAWTMDELISAIPENSKRDWYSFKLWPASAYCFLVSPGHNDSEAFKRKSDLDYRQILPPNLIANYRQLLLGTGMGEKFRKLAHKGR